MNPEELKKRPPGQLSPKIAVAGRAFSFFLGRIWIGLIDAEKRRMPAVPVLAMFREDDVPPGEPRPRILLGVDYGILEGRALQRVPVLERYDADHPTLESFGQHWWLRDDTA